MPAPPTSPPPPPWTARERAASVCSHVFARARPVLLVSREGGDWQFLCGEPHDVDERPRLVDLPQVFDGDPSLMEVRDLPPEWDAERSAVGAPWVRTPPP